MRRRRVHPAGLGLQLRGWLPRGPLHATWRCTFVFFNKQFGMIVAAVYIGCCVLGLPCACAGHLAMCGCPGLGLLPVRLGTHDESCVTNRPRLSASAHRMHQLNSASAVLRPVRPVTRGHLMQCYGRTRIDTHVQQV